MNIELLPKTYQPGSSEEKWYDFWESHGFFKPKTPLDDACKTYSIAIPPPNITGTLHMGHACRTTFEDVLARYHRMKGCDVLWVPGIDHAGIATQVVMERMLEKEGTTRHQLGRSKFTERIWEWKKQAEKRIIVQLKRMGASCDWSRTKFTMDEDLCDAVKHAFVELYDKGLIYRGTRLVNWDPSTKTVLSDLEVEQEEHVEGELFEFAYLLEGEHRKEIVVATTRAETMLGDSAIAVHPDDPRYLEFQGQFVKHPFVKRRIPIITDANLVCEQFGTGAVKVTPAHDPKDFETGKRHQLECINIFNPDATLNEEGGPFVGMDRFVARKAVKEQLAKLGLARGTKRHWMTLPRSQRSKEIIEPMISTQWFVKMKDLAAAAMEVVQQEEVVLYPSKWKKIYFQWLNHIQDWCISRQLWWGHPIPAWYCPKGHVNVAKIAPAHCHHCHATDLKQDEDVLDTWFSSSLWPFTIFGWPKETEELRRFYPTQDIETGYDILFFWVTRMIMMGLFFMKKPPFRRVLLGGLVCDEHGEKMSKVKGNVVDPLDVMEGASLHNLIEKGKASGASPEGLNYIKKTYPKGFPAYGADALRMTLLSYSPRAPKIALNLKRVEGYRNFSNKLWNAARYSLAKIEEYGDEFQCKNIIACGRVPMATASANRWILSSLSRMLIQAQRGIQEYRLDEASQTLYHFVWDTFCDWYLEITKPLIAQPLLKEETLKTLVHVLESIVRALHPMMPFISEEIWQRIPTSHDWGRRTDACVQSIMYTRYPSSDIDARVDEQAEREMHIVMESIQHIRKLRSQYHISPKILLKVYYIPDDEFVKKVWAQQVVLIESLTNTNLVLQEGDTFNLSKKESLQAAHFVIPGLQCMIPAMIDPIAEVKKN